MKQGLCFKFGQKRHRSHECKAAEVAKQATQVPTAVEEWFLENTSGMDAGGREKTH